MTAGEGPRYPVPAGLAPVPSPASPWRADPAAAPPQRRSMPARAPPPLSAEAPPLPAPCPPPAPPHRPSPARPGGKMAAAAECDVVMAAPEGLGEPESEETRR